MALHPPLPHQMTPYHRDYVARVPPGADVRQALERQAMDLEGLLGHLPPSAGAFRYAPGKWSLAETLGHLIDAEQIMACRLRRISRGDRTPNPGFDQDGYVAAGGFGRLALEALVREWRLHREAACLQIDHVPAEAWDRTGIANGTVVLARLFPFLMVGHVDHHLQVVRERILPGLR